jgi:hypothetical protein
VRDVRIITGVLDDATAGILITQLRIDDREA